MILHGRDLGDEHVERCDCLEIEDCKRFDIAQSAERRCGVCGRPEGLFRAEGIHLLSGHICEQCAHMSESRPFAVSTPNAA